MKTTDIFKKKVEDCYGLIEFSYQGKYGNVDPYFHNDGTYSYLLYFDGYEKTVYSIDDVMSTSFICGKSLNELGDTIEILS